MRSRCSRQVMQETTIRSASVSALIARSFLKANSEAPAKLPFTKPPAPPQHCSSRLYGRTSMPSASTSPRSMRGRPEDSSNPTTSLGNSVWQGYCTTADMPVTGRSIEALILSVPMSLWSTSMMCLTDAVPRNSLPAFSRRSP